MCDIRFIILIKREDLEVQVNHDLKVLPLLCKSSKHNAYVMLQNRVLDQFPLLLPDSWLDRFCLPTKNITSK